MRITAQATPDPTTPAKPRCEVCGGDMQFMQRASRERPTDYYQCATCLRMWCVSTELSAHWRRAGL